MVLENAKRALEHALAVADRNKAELIVVHVANIVSDYFQL